MEHIEGSLPYLCYAMAMANAALLLRTEEKLELRKHLEQYYKQYVHTNILVSIMVHPFYMLLTTLLRPHYAAFDRVMRDIKKSSENNSMSLGILMSTFNYTSTWSLVYTVVVLMLSCGGTSSAMLLKTLFSGVAVAIACSAMINLFGRLAVFVPHFKWYSFGLHSLCLAFGAGAVYFRPALSQLPPAMLAIATIMGVHASGYMFMRLATFDLPSREERGLSWTIHALFAAGFALFESARITT